MNASIRARLRQEAPRSRRILSFFQWLKPLEPMREFSRIKRLPPYVFNITAELKMAARRRGEDIIDLSMGNPDGPTPQHLVDNVLRGRSVRIAHRQVDDVVAPPASRHFQFVGDVENVRRKPFYP